MNEAYQNWPTISGNVKVKWQRVKRGGGFGLEAPCENQFEDEEEFDVCSGRLTEACNFKTPRLLCNFGFDEVRKKLDTLRLLSCQKICHLVIVV